MPTRAHDDKTGTGKIRSAFARRILLLFLLAKKKAWNKPLIPDSMLTEKSILLERKFFHISSLHLHDRLIILYLREANHFLQCHDGLGNFPLFVAKV